MTATKDIADGAGFNIFTSMCWIRRSGEDLDAYSKTPTQETDHYNIDIPNVSQPDLGLLRYHLGRMAASAQAVGWHDIPVLQKSEHALSLLRSHIVAHLKTLPELPADSIERRKLRIVVDKEGSVAIDTGVMDCLPNAEAMKILNNFVPRSLEVQPWIDNGNKMCKVYLDSSAADATIFTLHKTSHRNCYNDARNRADVAHSAPTNEEVMLYNRNGEMMEASLCTIYFWRNDQWITPDVPSGGNLGVTRRVALEKGFCKEGKIQVSELGNGEKIWLSNAARGFFVGEIVLNR